MDVDLSFKQYDAITSDAKITIYLAGIGTGKSLVAGMWLLERSKVPGSLGLTCATDAKQMKLATLPRLQEAWERLGYIADEHYVINRRPPAHWGIQPFTQLGSANILTWYWGSYLVLGGTENFQTYRGPQFDFIHGDETRDWRDIAGTLTVFTGRLRGQAYKERGLVSQMLLTTSPPDDPEEIESYLEGQAVSVIRGTTLDNLENLPPDYVDTLAAMLDTPTFERDVLGLMRDVRGTRALPGYVDAPHPDGNILDVEVDPARPITLTCDFNASQSRPMSWLVGQEHRTPDGRTVEVIVREFVSYGTSTEEQCEDVAEWLREIGYRSTISIRGDATGADAGRNSVTAKSDYTAMQQRLKSTQWKLEKEQTRRTRRIKDRLRALNTRLESHDKRRYMAINKRLCPKTDEALRKAKWDVTGKDLEKKWYADPVAALSYWPYYDHPVHHEEVTITHR